MDEDRGVGGSIPVIFGIAIAVVVYVLVAPFDCTRGGVCDGLVAFHYQPDSAGHWQALGAATLVGGAAALLLWLVLGSGDPGHEIAKVVATPLLLAGTAVSLLSQSVLLIVGPVAGGLVLWLMWGARGRARNPR